MSYVGSRDRTQAIGFGSESPHPRIRLASPVKPSFHSIQLHCVKAEEE